MDSLNFLQNAFSEVLVSNSLTLHSETCKQLPVLTSLSLSHGFKFENFVSAKSETYVDFTKGDSSKIKLRLIYQITTIVFCFVCPIYVAFIYINYKLHIAFVLTHFILGKMVFYNRRSCNHTNTSEDYLKELFYMYMLQPICVTRHYA